MNEACTSSIHYDLGYQYYAEKLQRCGTIEELDWHMERCMAMFDRAEEDQCPKWKKLEPLFLECYELCADRIRSKKA